MSHKIEAITILEGALFISDAHYNVQRDTKLFELLQEIEQAKIVTPQIIFMGDIFDFLIPTIEETISENKKVVDLINRLSEKINIIYLEGNHDYLLEILFPNIDVIPLNYQPLKAYCQKEIIYLAHGDYNLDNGYKIYTFLIRKRVVLLVLKYLNSLFSGLIVKMLKQKFKDKDQCYEVQNFKEWITQRVQKIFNTTQKSTLIEGHYHQGVTFQIGKLHYINLDAFACNQSYFQVQFYENDFNLLAKKYKT